MISGFDWDEGNWPKCAQHGVSKEEIEQLFEGTLAVMADPHPDEPRVRAIGKTRAGRYLFLVFMLRIVEDKTLVRPISARYMHQKEIAAMNANKLKSIPSLRSDAEAERFVETADLSEYNLSGFKPMRFEIEQKAATLNMRLPQNLLDAVKAKAKAKGVPYTRYVRLLLEQDLAH